MKSHLRYTVAAVALLSSVGVAAAGASGSSASSGSGSTKPMSTTTGAGSASMAAKTSDSLNLTSAQEKAIWQSVSKHDTKMKAPSGFTASVGTTVPASVALHPLPGDLTAAHPNLKPYEYAMLDEKLLIVNPMDKKVVDIITR